jgi:hypothetical protein
MFSPGPRHGTRSRNERQRYSTVRQIIAQCRIKDAAMVLIRCSGSCSTARSATLFAELAVSTLSTLLLAASNTCAQLLSSPTRLEVQRGHAKGQWLDIGVPSVRNLRFISGWRIVLWALRFSSSIPLHLLRVVSNVPMIDTRELTIFDTKGTILLSS